MTARRTFLFTGGGTGGHVTPALAIAEGIREQHPEANFVYVGVKGKAEDGMVQKAWKQTIAEQRASLHFVRSRSGSLKKPSILFTLGLGFCQALLLLLRFRPDAIVATGGYVSAPILFAAAVLRALKLFSGKIFLHEANAELGKMNQVAIRFADKVGFTFPGTKIPQQKKAFVGYPVRSSVVVKRDTDKEELRKEARERLGFPQDAKVIFAFGGSQGARTINRGIVAALPLLLADEKVIVVHGTGRQLKGNAYNGMTDAQKRLETVKGNLPADWESRYQPQDFIYNMGDYYAATDLVVCRGGAGSLYEVCANGVAAIVIPKANLPGDHQAVNARTLERLNAVRVIYERVDVTQQQTVETIEPEEFASLVHELLGSPQERQEMCINAMAQYEPSTSINCARIIDHVLGLGDHPQLREEPTPREEKVLGKNSSALERLLTQARIGRFSLTEQERRLALYKIDGWAADSGKVMPARACRMIGIGHFEERLNVLKKFAVDPSKSPFTRRDAFLGLRKMECLDDEIVDVLLLGTKDQYFEAVNEALYALSWLLRMHPTICQHRNKDILQTVSALTKSKEFDILMNAISVVTEVCDSFEQVKQDFEQNYFHPNWQVRKQLVHCFGRLMERQIVSSDFVAAELRIKFLHTSNGFQTNFQLKEQIREIFQRDKQREVALRLRALLHSEKGVEQTQNVNEQLRQIATLAKQAKVSINVTNVLEMMLEED